MGGMGLRGGGGGKGADAAPLKVFAEPKFLKQFNWNIGTFYIWALFML